jgi:hypothetical protein
VLKGIRSISRRDTVFAALRRMGLDEFGEVLMLMPMAEFPRLSAPSADNGERKSPERLDGQRRVCAVEADRQRRPLTQL